MLTKSTFSQTQNWRDWPFEIASNKDRLHVEKEGKIYVGVDAFLLVWKEIPKYKILYKFFKLPIVYHFFYISYEIVAFFLYLKNRKQLKN